MQQVETSFCNFRKFVQRGLQCKLYTRRRQLALQLALQIHRRVVFGQNRPVLIGWVLAPVAVVGVHVGRWAVVSDCGREAKRRVELCIWVQL